MLGTPFMSATGTIAGNTIVGHGMDIDPFDDRSGAISLYVTSGVVVADNRIIEPGSGILAYHTNAGLVVANNTIVDAWADNAPVACAVVLLSLYNDVTISGTKLIYGTKSAPKIFSRGLNISVDATNRVIDGGGNGWFSATAPVVGGDTTTTREHLCPRGRPGLRWDQDHHGNRITRKRPRRRPRQPLPRR